MYPKYPDIRESHGEYLEVTGAKLVQCLKKEVKMIDFKKEGKNKRGQYKKRYREFASTAWQDEFAEGRG